MPNLPFPYSFPVLFPFPFPFPICIPLSCESHRISNLF